MSMKRIKGNLHIFFVDLIIFFKIILRRLLKILNTPLLLVEILSWIVIG